MPRTIYLVVYNSPLFPAHWGLWVPQEDDDQNIGKFIHATGDARNGFQVEFKRNYNLDDTGRSHQLLPLAHVADQYVVDVKGDGSQGTGTTAHDYLSKLRFSITTGTKTESRYSKLSDMAPSGGGCTCTEWGHGRRSSSVGRQCSQKLRGTEMNWSWKRYC